MAVAASCGLVCRMLAQFDVKSVDEDVCRLPSAE